MILAQITNNEILFLGNTNGYIEKLFIYDKKNVKNIYKNLPYKILNHIKKIYFYFNLPKKSIWFSLNDIDWKKYKVIIIFECLYPIEVISYIRRKSKARIIYWLWDPIERNSGGKLYNSFNEHMKLNLLKNEKCYKCEIWSFDKADCKKYNLYYNNQTTIKFNLLKNNIKYDFFYIGHYKKGRDTILEELGMIFNSKNLNYKLYIVSNKENNKYKNIKILNHDLNYKEIVEYIFKTKCIIELVDKNQNGITWKPLEAMFYKRKLITNFEKIIEYDFYNPKNIFILGKDDISNIDEFINSKYEEIPEYIINKYTIDGWVDHFIKCKQVQI